METTLTVQFLMGNESRTYLGFDHEGNEKFATFVDYCEATEFGSYTEACEAIYLAKFQGLKFLNAKILGL